MKKPCLLDLYCCAGGAGAGYHQAGFDVVGVDEKPQPRYPFKFIQADVLGLDPAFLASFDAIHASPPCQAHSTLKAMHNAKEHADLIPQTRVMLQASGRPWVMENVVGARKQMRSPIMLCGTMFGLGVRGGELQRHRLFELSFPILFTPQCQHGSRDVVGVYGGHVRNRRRKPTVIGIYGHGQNNAAKWRGANKGVDTFNMVDGREAMGISWMTQGELSQAIPPAYTRWIGAQLLAALQTEARAA